MNQDRVARKVRVGLQGSLEAFPCEIVELVAESRLVMRTSEGPLMASAMRKANQKDLARLKEVLEAR